MKSEKSFSIPEIALMTDVNVFCQSTPMPPPLPIGRNSSFRLRPGEALRWASGETPALLHVCSNRSEICVPHTHCALSFFERLNSGEIISMAEAVAELSAVWQEEKSIAFFRQVSRLGAMELTSPAQDLVDTNRLYAAEKNDLAEWENFVAGFLEKVVFDLDVPKEGLIVELGTYLAHNFERLCRHYGVARCVGYDVCNYGKHPQVIERDVRTFTQADDVPIALGWNDISGWAASPQSKAAGFLFLARNVLPGGYYMDAALVEDPFESFGVTGFSLVVEWEWIKVFRRS